MLGLLDRIPQELILLLHLLDLLFVLLAFGGQLVSLSRDPLEGLLFLLVIDKAVGQQIIELFSEIRFQFGDFLIFNFVLSLYLGHFLLQLTNHIDLLLLLHLIFPILMVHTRLLPLHDGTLIESGTLQLKDLSTEPFLHLTHVALQFLNDGILIVLFLREFLL
jgi:hypothetical protein